MNLGEFDRVPLHLAASIPLSAGLGLSGSRSNPDEARYIRITDIDENGSLRSDIFASQPLDLVGDCDVEEGDILLAAAGGTAGKSYLHRESEGEFCYAGYLVRFRPNREIVDPRFIYYWTGSSHYWDQVLTSAVTSTIMNVSASRYSKFEVLIPPLETQQRIADYLDRETAEIDAAVADLDRYVKLLEKRGKVLIEKTVNGGTNSFSPLWSKIRVQNGFAFDSEKFSPTKELPVAKIGNVLPGDFSEFIDASELPSESFLIKDGDLVVGMSGDFNRTIWNKGKAALNQRVCILKPIADDDIRYINYAIGSGLKKIHSTKFSTTLKNLSTEEILAIRVPHRTVTEQKEIATYLDKETAEINDLVVESTRLRDLLLKRRSVLITEVITGRKQV